MTNEIATNELTFEVTVNTEITMHNEAKLNELVSAIEKKYANLVFTEDMLDEARKSRAELNKYSEAINQAKKDAKNDYNTPLNKFEEKIKAYIERIDEVNKPIGEKVKEFEENQRLERLEAVKQIIKEETEKCDVDAEGVAIQKAWLTKNISGKKRRQSIVDEVSRLQAAIEHKINEIAVVSDYCDALNLDGGGWLIQVEQGVPSGKVIASIKAHLEQEKARLEEQKRQEELKIAREKEAAEREAEAQLKAQAAQEERIARAKETPPEPKGVQSEPRPPYEAPADYAVKSSPVEKATVVVTNVLVLKLTLTKEQQIKLARFIKAEGIQSEKL